MSTLTNLPESFYLDRLLPFATAGTGFNPDTARAMAWAAQLAYETNDLDKIRRILAAWGWTYRGYHGGRIRRVLPLTRGQGFIAARACGCSPSLAGTQAASLPDLSLRLFV